jgi:ATP-dependent DNA helicase RecG
MEKIQTVDPLERDRMLAFEEGPYLDVKHNDITPAKLSRTISAFANTSGGELFIGIGEKSADGRQKRTWYGFKDVEEANPIFQILETMNPIGGHYAASFLQTDGFPGRVLQLLIFKTKDILRATDGTPYVRRGAQNLPVADKDGLRRLELDKGILSFKDNTLDISPADITNSKIVLSFLMEGVPSAEPEPWLAKQKLLVGNKPTIAGTLLFSDEPQTALPKRSAIKIYRYRTKSEEGSRDNLAFDPRTIEGCAYDQIRDAVAETKNIIEDISKLIEKGLEKVQYPHETLHEIITNAVLHRDYSIASDVHVRVFDNRVEVESPGRLPGHVTTSNILREQSARNPKIVRLINKFIDPPNKDVGEGLNTAFEAMKKVRLREPEIVEKENAVIVYIRHAPLASTHDLVMEFLESHEEITNRAARELTGIGSENSIKQVFLDLKARKLLEPVPGKKGNASAWRKFTGYWDQQPLGKEKDLLGDDFE